MPMTHCRVRVQSRLDLGDEMTESAPAVSVPEFYARWRLARRAVQSPLIVAHCRRPRKFAAVFSKNRAQVANREFIPPIPLTFASDPRESLRRFDAGRMREHPFAAHHLGRAFRRSEERLASVEGLACLTEIKQRSKQT